MKKFFCFASLFLFSLTLIACGKNGKFTVEFITNLEGVTVNEQLVKKNDYAVDPNPEIPDTHYLEGWFINSDFSGEKFVFESTAITTNLILYAKIVVKQTYYTVFFEVDFDDIIIPAQTIEKDHYADSPSVSVPASHKFLGWYVNDDFSGEKFVFESTAITGDLTLYGRVVDINLIYSVTFVLNNGDENVIVEAYDNEFLSPLKNITNDNKHLSGWFLNDDFEDEMWDFKNDRVTSDLVLYARWSDVTTVRTQQVGGNRNLDNNSSVNNAAAISLEPNHFNVRAFKGTSTIPGVYNNEIRLYVNSAIDFTLHDSYVISKIEIAFSKYNDTIGKTNITLGSDVVSLTNHNNLVKTYDDLNINYFKIHNTSTVTVERVYIKYIEITYYQIGPSVEKEDDINRPVIDISEHQLTELEIGDTFNHPALIASDIEDGEVLVEYDKDTVNMNAAGIYYVFYYAIDSDANKSEAYITVIVRVPNTVSNYYQNIDTDKDGADFKENLQTLLKTSLSLVSYGTGNQSIEISDRDPNNFNNVWLIYSSTSIRGTWNSANWAKEHVWAKSAFGSDAQGNVYSISGISSNEKGIGSDLHNLRAINKSVNSSHSNYQFANNNGTDGYPFGKLTIAETLLNPHTPGKDTVLTTSAFYPGDAHKGDVARILLYMNTLWGLLLREDIEMLVTWHLDDPVDNFEVIRNEVIYSYQGNRNPYIDYPEFVQKVYH